MSSIINQKVHIHFPDFGSLKYRKLFNGTIFPRNFYKHEGFAITGTVFHILYCNLSNTQDISSNFSANHFVPLINRKMKRSLLSDQPGDKKITKRSIFNPFTKKSMFDYFKTSQPKPIVTSSAASIVTSCSSVSTSATNSILTTSAFSFTKSINIKTTNSQNVNLVTSISSPKCSISNNFQKGGIETISSLSNNPHAL